MKITVHSVIENLTEAGLVDGEPEVNVITMDAAVNKIADTTVISYTEQSEGGPIQTRLTIKDFTVHLSRRGAIEWSVMFDEGALISTIYKIPPYSFDCKVKTKRVRITEGDVYEIRLIYSMDIGGGEKNVRMRITLS